MDFICFFLLQSKNSLEKGGNYWCSRRLIVNNPSIKILKKIKKR